ncbi:MAG: thioredoxin family protein [Saprospiraceae bacterium]|nr:thioredoxin family protein [Saprospiraceae bacterium]
MRNILILTGIYLSGITYISGQGIDFRNDDWNTIKKIAAENDKHILVDVYTDWCVPCKKMNKEVFSIDEVGDSINPHFISYKVNAEKGNGIELSRDWSVRAYPTIMYLEPSGKEVTRFEGFRPKETFLAFSSEVLALSELELESAESMDLETVRFLLNKFRHVDIEHKEDYLNKWWLNLSSEETNTEESVSLIRANLQYANVEMIKAILPSITGFGQVKFIKELNDRMSLWAETEDLNSINEVYKIQLKIIKNSLFASTLKPEILKNYDKVRLKLYKKHPKYDPEYLELSRKMMEKYVMSLSIEDVRRMEKTFSSSDSLMVSKKLVDNIKDISYNYLSKYDDPQTLQLVLSWLDHGQQLFYDDQATIIQLLLHEKLGNEDKAKELKNIALKNPSFEFLNQKLVNYLK